MGYSYEGRFNRRILWIRVGLSLFSLLVVGRLFQLQVVNHGQYLATAASEQSRKFIVEPKRGQIYLRDGDDKSPLALNQTLKLVYADPSQIEDAGEVAEAIAAVTGDNAQALVDIIKRGGGYQVLKRKVSSDIGQKIIDLNLTGIGVLPQNYRTYPEGQLASQLLGFVNSDGAGQYGLEGYLNADLAGKPGLLKVKTDTKGNQIAIANSVEKPAVDGKSYVLTIDRNIQAYAEKALQRGVQAVRAKSGSVVIVDPANGEVMAMANYPTYDPNNYGAVSDYNTFLNRVVSNQFEPGSGFKVITMAAGLASGKVKSDTHFNDTGEVQVDGRTIRNAENHKFGDQTMVDVIQKSLNTGVIFVLKSLGGDPNTINLAGKKLFNDYMRKFGFGVATGIEQAGEAAGAINPPTNASGNNVNYANMTFGQGMSVTMMQMVMAMGAIANGGKLYQPRLVDQVISPEGEVTEVQSHIANGNVIDPQVGRELTHMMEQVVQRGSGYMTKVPGYKVAGKTGTAQIPRSDGKGYEEGKNIGTFVGFAPADSPRFVMMVRVDEPQTSGFAESTTVPIFGDITKWLFNYLQVPPSS